MAAAGKSRNGADPPMGEALSRIEAALQAGLGAEGSARPDLARRALAGGPEPDEQLEAWLEAVAAELQSSKAALVPSDMVEAIAERMRLNRHQSLGAHGRIGCSALQALVRPG